MIFSSSCRDFYYTSASSALTYTLSVDGQPVYWGKAVNPSGIRINIGRRIADWLETHMPDFRGFDGEVVEHPRQMRVFNLYDDSGSMLESYTVLLDSDGSWTGGYAPLSQPINGHSDSRQKIFWTMMSETGETVEIETEEPEPEPDYSSKYLTLDIISGGTIEFRRHSVSPTPSSLTIYYSLNDGTEWDEITVSSENGYVSINVNDGDKVLLKGTNSSYYDYGLSFQSTAVYNAEGNILSLVNGDDFIGVLPSSVPEMWFQLFFANTNIVSAKNLVLCPTLSVGCYSQLFNNCPMLTEPPKLDFMELAEGCYGLMFANCPSLATAPALPATVLQKGCYDEMFKNCSSLVEAPALPATALTENCYFEMFRGCSSLTKSPVLVGEYLAAYCYKGMFYQCTSLSEVTCLAKSSRPNTGTEGWLGQVAASGIFKKLSSTTFVRNSINGIPSGWTVVDAV